MTARQTVLIAKRYVQLAAGQFTPGPRALPAAGRWIFFTIGPQARTC